jgi:hypothetical protein
MTIANYTEWEVRLEGADTNGSGFYDRDPGTSVDYSQQDAAQLALTDIATDGSGTGVSSVTGGFTAAMVGNCMYLAGSGVTTGWYEILTYTDTNNVTIDRTAGASATGATGNVGGAWLPSDALANTYFNGTNKRSYNIVHWKTGEYDMLTALLTMAGGYTSWIGYDTVRGDVPNGDARPHIDFLENVGYITWSGSYGRTKNLRITNSNPSVSPSQPFYASGAGHQQFNCKVVRMGGGVNNYGMRFNSDYGFAVQCEYISEFGIALMYADKDFAAMYCYIHDSYRGSAYTSSGASGAFFTGCIYANLGDYGANAYYATKFLNCTFYNCTVTGLYSASVPVTAFNCIFHTCGKGFQGPVGQHSDNNIFYNNGVDFSGGLEAGPRDLFIDPLMVDPANGDFTLAAGSPCFNTGYGLGTQVGLA